MRHLLTATGQVNFKEYGDVLTFKELTLRTDGHEKLLQFNVETTWYSSGNWTLRGEATEDENKPGSYKTRGIKSVDENDKEYEYKSRLFITIRQTPEGLSVSGKWFEERRSFAFKGNLEIDTGERKMKSATSGKSSGRTAADRTR